MSTNTAGNINLDDRIRELFPEPGLQGDLSGTCFGVDKWSACSDRNRFATVNPADGQVLAEVYASNAADYEQVLVASEHGFRYWKNIPAPKRGELVRQLGELLREYKDPLGSLVSLEMGKIKQEGDGEVQEMIDIADFAVGQSRMLYGRTMHSERAEHRMYEQWHPLGPVAVISAFNFPVAVWAWNAFIAAICGNTVIWKPSPKTPLCAIAVQHLCNQAMQRCDVDGVFTLMIPDENELATRLVDDRRVPLVSFTGSTSVGRQVGTRVSERMGRSLLELSGNNALIVDATADFALAVPSIIFGFVGTAGQRCTTTRRLFVHESRYGELIERLKNAVTQVRIGNPLDEQVLMGPLIDEQAVKSYEATMAEVRELGGEVICGGNRISSPGYFVEPTIVKAQNDWPVVQRETFAPILYVMTFSELDEAIAMQNNVSQGLSSAIFTESLRNAEQFLSVQGSDCGIANVNIGTSGAEIGGAFGGEKETGGGREAGSDSWKAYMRRQTNTINWSSELPLAQGIKFNLD